MVSRQHNDLVHVHPSACLRSYAAYQHDTKRALQGLLLPLALMSLGYGWLWYMHSIIPVWQQLICWLTIGTGYAGLFNLAHECARGSFLPNNPSCQVSKHRLCLGQECLHGSILPNKHKEEDGFAWPMSVLAAAFKQPLLPHEKPLVVSCPRVCACGQPSSKHFPAAR
ncbi:hypothetical protein DUNSADRAFT_15655 [Dunaliella salina]|uniref:Uncharacterized protein n=1 Tax=Dunaliella salina TaxID=3046 RepID=A0ABQ7G4Z9_DUNSA|nr:hypothetical protein DUNSADRAFT_15655 [Dunaliella salina]|eukprot:KAF5829680.1 hypothetical protein DUNSADRAFT_15655 [Dunaliella salina]